MIKVLIQVRKNKYKDNLILPEGLDLVEEDEQITHQIQLDEELENSFSSLFHLLDFEELTFFADRYLQV